MTTMNPLPVFVLQRPQTLDDALALLAADPGGRLLGGGTDLLPNLRRGLGHPAQLIELGAVPELSQLTCDAQGDHIGAGVTLQALVEHAGLAERHPALVQAAAGVAAPAHRGVATLGGNLCQDTRCVYYNQSEWWRAANGWCLKHGGDTCHVAPQGGRCHAAFSGDLAAALIALDARVELASSGGDRRLLPLADLYRDDGMAHLTLAAGELLLGVHLSAPPPGQRSAYRKARVRASIEFPLAGVGVALRLDDQRRLVALRVGLSGTNSNPLLIEDTDALLGRPVDDTLLAELGKRVARQVSPMRSTATPSNYRRQVAAALVRRLVGDLGALGAP